MAQQILNVSTPNSGLGDALRDASIKSNSNFTELYEGKVDKVIGKDLSDNNLTDALVAKINDLEANAQVNIQSDWNENDIEADAYIKNKPEQLFSSLGYFDYADLSTQTTPITVLPNTQTLLTNDTLGDDTNTSQPPYGVTAIWDADSDEFNFQQLSVGDTVDIRVHLKTTTTSANQKYHIDMKFAFDGPDEFENRIFSQYVKNASEDEQSFVTTLYIGSESVRTYPARLYITSDDDATVEVVGWFCRVFRKSVNIVDIITDEAPIDGLTYGRKDAEWVEVSGGGSTPDATTTVKGKLKLAGDLAGTADLPTVPALALKQDTLTETNFGSFINGLTAKNTLVDADEVVSDDSADSNKAKKTSWLNVWLNYLKPKADALYQAILTDVTFGTFSTALTPKTTPVDADTVNLVDSADSNKSKKVTLTNFKAFLKTYFDTQYQPRVSFKLTDTVASSDLTGTTTETVMKSYTIAANSFAIGDFFNVKLHINYTTANAGSTRIQYLKVSNTNNYATANTVLQNNNSASNNYALLRNSLYFVSGNILRTVTSETSRTIDNGNFAVYPVDYSLNPTQPIYVWVGMKNSITTDVGKFLSLSITN